MQDTIKPKIEARFNDLLGDDIRQSMQDYTKSLKSIYDTLIDKLNQKRVDDYLSQI